jgi:ABC-type nitrate/sulfonate/bicarbonate transport system substrate-binding protein
MRKLVMALLVCVALAGCGSRDETTVPKTQTPMRVSVTPGSSSGSLIAGANKAGLFRDAGLTTTVESGPTALEAVASGRAELAVASEPAVLQARSHGLNVVSVASLVHGSRVAVISTSKVSSPRDLAGKRLGVVAGPYEQAFARTLSARAGGGGIKLVHAPNPSKELQKHQVDAVLGPVSAVHVKKAQAVPVDRLGVPTYDEEVLVATGESTKSRGDDIRSFIGALWHQAQGKAPGAQSPAEWRAFAEWMQANELLTRQPNAAAAVTNALLPGLHA